ncbi:hypothetical protein F5146DRAFT_1004218 [Armillaria mellea]|nr:hypothetical protein F5146DRAFT_1004218 [Armillaria mellea]
MEPYLINHFRGGRGSYGEYFLRKVMKQIPGSWSTRIELPNDLCTRHPQFVTRVMNADWYPGIDSETNQTGVDSMRCPRTMETLYPVYRQWSGFGEFSDQRTLSTYSVHKDNTARSYNGEWWAIAERGITESCGGRSTNAESLKEQAEERERINEQETDHQNARLDTERQQPYKCEAAKPTHTPAATLARESNDAARLGRRSKPQIFRPGDIVQIQLLIVAVAMKNSQKKMKLKLRSIALIDEGFSKREWTLHIKSLKAKAEARAIKDGESVTMRSLKRKVGYWGVTML